MAENVPIFKSWVPNWLAILTIFTILFPSLVIFALYYNSTLATAEYYSLDAMDIQYSVVLMYATVISYLALDSQLIKCFKLVDYTAAGIFINTITCWICAETTQGEIFMFCRFIQGAVCAFLCNICMNLAFTRFHVSKARIFGYTIFYGCLMVCVPFSAIFANIILHYFGIESVFYGFILLFLTMNNRYLFRKFPLAQIDWTGFIIYTAIVSMVGYILVYGQQLEWFTSPKICLLSVLTILLIPVYAVSSLAKKRPMIQLRLLKNPKYCKSLVLLTVFYISKGTTFITYVYMQDTLGFDSVNMIKIWALNILGLLIGIALAAKLLLKAVHPQTVIKLGFSILLIFHVLLFFMFASTGSIEKFYIPLFIQGVGTGSLFVPLIMNMVMSVTPKQAGLVAPLGIASRFLGFCLAIALINFFQLYNTNRHYMDMAANYTLANKVVLSQEKEEMSQFKAIGYSDTQTKSLTKKSINKTLKNESVIRANMNYYSFIMWLLFIFLVFLMMSQLPKLRPLSSILPRRKKENI